MIRILQLVLAFFVLSVADVTELTVENFDSITQATTGNGGDWLVEFYAPWCGFCKKLAPIWETLPSIFEEEGIPCNIGKVDVTVNKPLGARFEVTGFPSIFYISEGKYTKYGGARTAESFVDFVKAGHQEGKDRPVRFPLSQEELDEMDRQMEERARRRKRAKPPPVDKDGVYLLDSQNFDGVVNSQRKPILIKFYAPWCGHCKRLAPTWAELAKDAKGGKIDALISKVDVTADALLGSRFQIQGFPTIKAIVKGKVYEYSGGRDKKSLIDFLKSDWSTLEGVEIPPASFTAKLEALMTGIARDLGDAWKNKRAMLIFVLCTGIMLGLTVASLVSLCMPSPAPTQRRPPRRPSAPPSAPTAAVARAAGDKPKTE